MCILCAVQRWSRRVANVLPWLVVPLLVLWGASQLLFPAAYRFEVTSPRLACVSVLLLTLFWYEILIPRLSNWRTRRSARLREERRARALELHKLRKSATRRCRNCNNPYRDQNPGGGKFMCSYCGHVSKRPVLDLSSVGKVSRGWPCGQDCGSPYWPQLGENSFLGFARRLLSSSSVTIKWFLSKAFSFRSSGDSEADGKTLAKRGDNEGKAEESRVDKAKRKAEEKRLARLEKEMLEEEERKQREEMAKLVEERRKLRDEKAEVEERSKSATPVGEKDARREADKRRLDRRKKDDKGSSKSNSDCEDMDRRLSREGDKKRDLERKGEPERRDGNKPHHFEANSHSSKVEDSKAKYFGRMAGGFLSSSRGFASGSFFGRTAQAPLLQVSKVSRPVVPATEPRNAIKRDLQHASAQAAPKSAAAGETKHSWTNFNRPVSPNVQPPPTAPKKSWHQLFSRSASVSPCPDVTASAHEINKPEPNDWQISNAHNFLSQYPPLDSKPNLSRSMQFPGFSSVKGARSNTTLPHFPAGHMPFYEAEPTVIEESEQFEDPCYDPDAIALALGTLSKSLDFPQDLDCGFISRDVTKESHPRPSPIESPISRSRAVEEKPTKPGQPSITKGPDGSILPKANNEQGTYQMWSTPLVQETLGLQGPQSQWLLPSKNQISHGPNFLNGGTRSPLCTSLNDSDPWQQKTPRQQLPPDTPSLFLPHDLTGKAIRNDMGFGSPNKSARAHPFGPPGRSWSKEGDPMLNGNGLKESYQFCSPRGAHVGGGFFSANPDVQSVWSFSEKETT